MVRLMWSHSEVLHLMAFPQVFHLETGSVYGGLAVDESLKVDRLTVWFLWHQTFWMQTLALGAMQLQSDQHVNALALVGMFDAHFLKSLHSYLREDHPGSWLQSEASLLYFFLYDSIYIYYNTYIYIYIIIHIYIYIMYNIYIYTYEYIHINK